MDLVTSKLVKYWVGQLVKTLADPKILTQLCHFKIIINP